MGRPAEKTETKLPMMDETWFYVAFGLNFKANRPIPGLIPLKEPATVEAEVCLDGFPPWLRRLLSETKDLWFVSPWSYRGDEPFSRVWRVAGGDYVWLSYGDGAEFVVNRAGTRVWAQAPEAATPEYMATYLLRQVFGIVLRLQGITCLHGSAIAVDQRALALLGHSAAGKSTAAAAFARLGFPVLTDDITAFREEGGSFMVSPGEPAVSLWAESVTHLCGSPEALPLIIPDNVLMPEWDKRCLDLTAPGYRFQSQPLPLGGIYILGERCEDADPVVEILNGREALLALLSHAYARDLLDQSMQAQEFAALSRVLDTVPVRRVIRRAGLEYLSESCEMILEDFYLLGHPA